METAVIIGAGPAGLTAAFELLEKTGIRPVVFEMTGDIGGISKTVDYKGNRIDIGGHRFFSKSGRVMKWWMDMMPVEENGCPDPEKTDNVLLIRSRLSRIFYLRSFFSYPVSLSADTIRNLGLVRTYKILTSFAFSMICPVKEEKTLEDFMVNRFGRELFNTFFKDYTEKVWGVKCSEISAEWGRQRIKGLSVAKTLTHAAGSIFRKKGGISQRETETSLIEKFLYPKLGPGQMWGETARRIRGMGGEVNLNRRVKSLEIKSGRAISAVVEDTLTGKEKVYAGDYFFSTMPVKDLIASIRGDEPPEAVKKTAWGLPYRDFITVGLLLKKLHLKTKRSGAIKTFVPDNWIYIQEREVKLGRLQVFNNWSPYMVKDPKTIWIGLEYFCSEGDELWNKSDSEFARFAAGELARIDFIRQEDVLDSVVIRVLKTYPAYFGSYRDFGLIRSYTDKIENLFLIGRNGMHKYNNSDHSMLTAIAAVENISAGVKTKDNIWAVNTEEDYHEEK